jgi:hypothetical protein
MKRLFLLVCVLALSCSFLSAGPVLEYLTFSYTDNTINRPVSVNDQNIGWSFTVGASPITVNQLSWYDPDNAVGQAHQVGIYLDSATTPVVQGCIGQPCAGGLSVYDAVTDYWTLAVTPTTLTAGSTYVIGGRITKDEKFVWFADSAGPTLAGTFTFGTNRYDISVAPFTLAKPTSILASPPAGPEHLGFFGPNFGTDVPEPATMILMGAGLVLVGALRKKFGKA